MEFKSILILIKTNHFYNLPKYIFRSCIWGIVGRFASRNWRWKKLQKIQAYLWRCSGKELLDKLLWNELDHRQAQIHGQEMANPDRSICWCKNNRWIPCSSILYWFHLKAKPNNTKNLLCPISAGMKLYLFFDVISLKTLSVGVKLLYSKQLNEIIVIF